MRPALFAFALLVFDCVVCCCVLWLSIFAAPHCVLARFSYPPAVAKMNPFSCMWHTGQVAKASNFRDLLFDMMRRQSLVALIDEVTAEPDGEMAQKLGPKLRGEILADETMMTRLNAHYVPRPRPENGVHGFLICIIFDRHSPNLLAPGANRKT